MRRLLAIGFVWICCSAAWAILGATLLGRSGAVTGDLAPEVHALWGPPRRQEPPHAIGRESHRVRVRDQRWDEHGGRFVAAEQEKTVSTERALPLDGSDVTARLALVHRRKGLVWFPTYAVELSGRYAFRNDTGETRTVEVVLPLEKGGVIYEGFEVKDGHGRPVEVSFAEGQASFRRTLAPGEGLPFTVAYRTRGTGSWAYGGAGGIGPEAGRARNFQLTVETNFADVDFPAGTLSPTVHQRIPGGWRGTWRFDQIVGTANVGLELPQRLNPGPLAARITFFAPVALLFFFFVTGVLLAASGRSMHPMSYFLLACAFFAFHLLFAYLIDHLAIAPAFALASVVSLALAASYARLFLGWRTALLQVAGAQLVYLVLFSFTFFWKGFTGLAITIGAILTLFVIMQRTGRLDWDEALARRAPGGT